MKHRVTTYFVALVILVVLDVAWFAFSMDRLYHPLMGDLIAPSPNFVAAGLFYLVYALGLCYFVVFPQQLSNDARIKKAIKPAAFFGLVAYGTYDLTALAVIKGFSAKLVVVDLIWGVCAAIAICSTTLFISAKFSRVSRTQA